MDNSGAIPTTATGKAWQTELESGDSYVHECRSRREYRKLLRLPRVWRLILRRIGLTAPARGLEVGCGGGQQLLPLALNGFEVSGLDVSAAVLRRAQRYIDTVARYDRRPRAIALLHADFLCADLGSGLLAPDTYDIVFNFGVVEHFLDDTQRQEFLRRKFYLTKAGGYVVSVVPSGVHPFRAGQRAHGWGGYNVPEIDYSPATLRAEMAACGGARVAVLPYNLLGYRLARSPSAAERALHLCARLVDPFLPLDLRNRHATTFIAIAQKGRHQTADTERRSAAVSPRPVSP